MYVFGAGRMPARLKPSGSRARPLDARLGPSLFPQVVHSYFYRLASLIFRLIGNKPITVSVYSNEQKLDVLGE